MRGLEAQGQGLQAEGQGLEAEAQMPQLGKRVQAWQRRSGGAARCLMSGSGHPRLPAIRSGGLEGQGQRRLRCDRAETETPSAQESDPAQAAEWASSPE